MCQPVPIGSNLDISKFIVPCFTQYFPDSWGIYLCCISTSGMSSHLRVLLSRLFHPLPQSMAEKINPLVDYRQHLLPTCTLCPTKHPKRLLHLSFKVAQRPENTKYKWGLVKYHHNHILSFKTLTLSRFTLWQLSEWRCSMLHVDCERWQDAIYESEMESFKTWLYTDTREEWLVMGFKHWNSTLNVARSTVTPTPIYQ